MAWAMCTVAPVRPTASGERALRRAHAQAGYTYLLILFVVAGLGLLAAGLGQTWRDRAQREREAELLAVGVEMARALASYQNRSPDAGKQWPESLDVLVEDRRFATPQRHLRRIYRDPMTGETDWGLVRDKGKIVGIHSLSEKVPFKTHDLPEELGEGGESAKSYREWVFRPVMPASGGEQPQSPERD